MKGETVIDPKQLRLIDLLSGRLFTIPEYQRTYSWKSRQRRDFFDDVRGLLASDDATVEHYMSTVVVLNRGVRTVLADDLQVVEVVDGQQRLTTIVILLKALSNRLCQLDGDHEKIGSALRSLLVKGDDASLVLLQTNHDTTHIFRDYLRRGDFEIPEEAPQTQSDRNIRDAIIECEKFVEGFDLEALIPLVRTIRNRLVFILHSLDDERIVYTVFEVLNSRGLPVAWIDRLKSMLMAKVFEMGGNTDANVRELHEIWKDTYRALEMSSGAEPLRFAAVLKTGERTKGKLLSEELAVFALLEWCQLDLPRIIEASRWIVDVIRATRKIRSNPRIRALTRVSQARFVAIAIELSTLSPDDKAKLFEEWERAIFRVFGVARKDSRTLSGKLIKLGIDIYSGAVTVERAIQILRKLSHDQAPYEVLESLMSADDWYPSWSSELRYLFYRYEEFLAASEGERVDTAAWEKIWSAREDDTIEHVFPISRADENDLTDEGVSVHRLGNLTILPPGLNSHLGNKDFTEKRLKYSESTLRSVREVAAFDAWGKTEILERERKITDWVVQNFLRSEGEGANP